MIPEAYTISSLMNRNSYLSKALSTNLFLYSMKSSLVLDLVGLRLHVRSKFPSRKTETCSTFQVDRYPVSESALCGSGLLKWSSFPGVETIPCHLQQDGFLVKKSPWIIYTKVVPAVLWVLTTETAWVTWRTPVRTLVRTTFQLLCS